jgi:hypothetical protein
MKKFFSLLIIFIACLWCLFMAGLITWDLYRIAVSWKIKTNILADFVFIIVCILVAIIFFMLFKEGAKDET